MTRASRRRTLVLILAATVAGCAIGGADGPSAAPTLQSDVMLISTGLSGIVAALQATPGISLPPTIAAQAQAILADIEANAGAIAASLVPNPRPIEAIKTAVNTLANVLAPYLPAAPSVSALIQAALALVPVILAMAGVSAAGTRRPTMAPEQARAVLKSKTGR